MNIVVNHPAKTLPHFGRYRGSRSVFWPVAKKPEKLNVGDNVYVAIDGKIGHYYLFRGFAKDPKCEITERIIPGLVMLLSVSVVTLHKDLPVKKFRGFKYINID